MLLFEKGCETMRRVLANVICMMEGCLTCNILLPLSPVETRHNQD